MRSSSSALFGAASLTVLVVLMAAPSAEAPATGPPNASAALRTASVPFVENVGQAPAHVRFSATTFAGSVHVTDAGTIVYGLASESDTVLLRERAAAPRDASVSGTDGAPTQVSFIRGDDPSRWVLAAPTYEGVRIEDVADGVALEVRAHGSNVEKLFHVSPQADASSIRMTIDGALGLAIGSEGTLDVSTPRGTLQFTRPHAFQPTATGHDDITCGYVVERGAYGFRLGEYDRSRPLIIDPLFASTYLGGTAIERAYQVVSSGESVFIVGQSASTEFPTTQGVHQEAGPVGTQDGFIARFSPDLTTLEACTFLGGSATDTIYDLVFSDGGIVVTGSTGSSNFPTTIGAFQRNYAGGGDAFVCRLNRDLTTLEASTFIGEDGFDEALRLAESARGIYVVGDTWSNEFHVPPSAMQGDRRGPTDGWVVRLDAALTSMTAGTLLGGASGEQPQGLVVADDEVWLTGSTTSVDFPVGSPAAGGPFQPTNAGANDAFVTRLDADLTTLIASTYLGGAGASSPQDYGIDIALHDGSVFVCGTTQTNDFPTTPGAFDETQNALLMQDAFVARLDRDLSTLEAGTYFGGVGYDSGAALVVDDRGVFFTGITESEDLPVGPMSDDTTLGGGGDAYVAALSLDLTQLLDSRYLGGSARQFEWPFAMSPLGEGLLLTGSTTSEDFPVTQDAYDTTFAGPGTQVDVWVTHLALNLPGPAIDSYFVPKKLDVKHNAKKPEKSTLIAAGWFDTGSQVPDFERAAVLTVGGTAFQVPRLSLKGKWYRYVAEGVDFRTKPSNYQSSKAKFKLKVTGAAAVAVDPDRPVMIRYQSGPIDAIGEVQLTRGRYKLGKVRGALLQPALALYNCKTGVKGDGQDTIRVRLGLATGAGAPNNAPPLTLRIGNVFEETVPADAFVDKGEKFSYRGPKGSIGKAVLDYAKEKLNVAGKKVEIGDFAEGAQPVLIRITLGDEEYAVWCRMHRAGKIMRY